jgi:indolepyruvate ferredoxin oxidoreductase beta subunit
MKPGIDRPLTMLIGALGGEGGGVMADWIVQAAERAGFLVQSTSIPGVAQRTGATTYYLELMKPKGKKQPVFALYPAPGHMDVVITTELVEAGRAIENGFVAPDRTCLITSSHRVYAIMERTAMGDGTQGTEQIIAAAKSLAKKPIIQDFADLALKRGVALNAILLGVLAASGAVPIAEDDFLAAIAARGVAAEANKAGFAAGLEAVRGGGEATPISDVPSGKVEGSDGLAARVSGLPAPLWPLAKLCIERLVDFQDEAYGRLYLGRLEKVIAAEQADTADTGLPVSSATARFLALWMAYEDVIRVADLKTRASRIAGIRSEAGAGEDEPVRITEFLKPGLEEAATVLPARLGRAITRWADNRGLTHKLHVPLRLRSDTIVGFLAMRTMAKLKFRRRRGLRYAQEQDRIERWLKAVEQATRQSAALGLAIANLGRLIKGYSDTRQRAFRNLDLIHDRLIEPALSGSLNAGAATEQIALALEAALADEDGVKLNQVLDSADEARSAQAAE